MNIQDILHQNEQVSGPPPYTADRTGCRKTLTISSKEVTFPSSVATLNSRQSHYLYDIHSVHCTETITQTGTYMRDVMTQSSLGTTKLQHWSAVSAP
jgi:hypothetical protein